MKPITEIENDLMEQDLVRLSFNGGGEFFGRFVGRENGSGINYFLFSGPFCGDDDYMKDYKSVDYLSPNSWVFTSGPARHVESYEILETSD